MSPDQSAVPARPRARLFVYDRHDLSRLSLQEMFESEGFEVVGTDSDPDRAAERILALGPDLCVLDVGIPHGTGVALCRRLQDSDPAIPCIVLAPWHVPELAAAAAAAGAKAFVLKNVFTAELLAAVAAALDSI